MPRRCTAYSSCEFQVPSFKFGGNPELGTLNSKPRRRILFQYTSARCIIDLCLIALIVIFPSAAACAQEKIRIAPSSPGLAAWPVHLAAKVKFFAAECLDAEFIVMRTDVGVAALVCVSIGFTTAGGSAMRAAVNGAPLKMVLNTTKKADLWVLSQKNIQRVEDLRG